MNESTPRAALAITLACLTLCALDVSAEPISPPISPMPGEPAFESIGIRQSLPSSAINTILVDRYGFVWFASSSGVHRYDGQSVQSIDHDPNQNDTLNSRENAALAQTSDAMWILSFGGVLQRLDSASGKVENFALEHNGDRAGRGTRLLADRAERLWIGTEFGLFRFDPKTRKADFVSLGDSEQPRIVALAASMDGAKLFAGRMDGRLFAIDIDNPSHVEPLASLGRALSLVIAPTQQLLWLGTVEGLFRYDFATGTFDQAGIPAELTRGRVDAVAIADDGALWVGGEHHVGLTRFDPGTGESVVYRHHPDDPYSLPSNLVAALTIDGSDNLWIRLQDEGTARVRVSEHGITRYRAPDGRTTSFCATQEMPDGRILVALCGGSVALFDPRRGVIEDRAVDVDSALPFAQPTLSSHAIVADGHGGYWLPTNNVGLLNWQPDLRKAKRYPLIAPDGSVLADRYMNDAAVAHDGRLWVATSTGLATLAPGESQLRMLSVVGPPGKLLTGGVRSITIGSDSELWLGTTQGLVRFDPDSHLAQQYVNDPNNPHSLSDNLVVATHADASGSIWIGTQTGLNRASFENGTLRMRRYALADGLPDQTIDAITHDAKGTLWVGTYKGIARFDAEHDRFIALGAGEGIPETAINWRAALASSDGSIYFGSASGLWRIFPNQLHTAKPRPVMLSSYEVGSTYRINLCCSDVEPLTTAYTEAHVRFNVTAFGDHRPMSYRMTGLDSRWKHMPPTLSVSYDPLPPGSYRFEVRQGDDDSSNLSIPVTVSPPPWRTPQAYLLYLAVLLLLVFVYRQKLRLRILERQALDARLRLLQAQVAPHFLFNTLANVQALVKAQSPRAEKVLRNVIAYLRASVPQLNERATTLGQELQLVQAYLELMCTRFPDHIQFAVHADESTYSLRCPPLTLLTLVENAVRHGIDPSENGGRIDIEVQRLNERCVIRVIDTGVGFRQSSDIAGTGLSILRERLQLFFRGEAQFRMSPLSPHGTIAEIEIPARRVD